MGGHRIGTIELLAHRARLLRLRVVELRRLDHRDIVVGARDRAIAASDTHVVLEIDLALRAALDSAGRATVHALGIVAMAAGGWHQVFAELDTGTDKPALA